MIIWFIYTVSFSNVNCHRVKPERVSSKAFLVVESLVLVGANQQSWQFTKLLDFNRNTKVGINETLNTMLSWDCNRYVATILSTIINFQYNYVGFSCCRWRDLLHKNLLEQQDYCCHPSVQKGKSLICLRTTWPTSVEQMRNFLF